MIKINYNFQTSEQGRGGDNCVRAPILRQCSSAKVDKLFLLIEIHRLHYLMVM